MLVFVHKLGGDDPPEPELPERGGKWSDHAVDFAEHCCAVEPSDRDSAR
eukprot:gene46491-53135_t